MKLPYTITFIKYWNSHAKLPCTCTMVWFRWFGLLRIYVALAVFQPYRDLEAGDNQSLKIQVARRGIEPRTSCSASQELNHSATAAPLHVQCTSGEAIIIFCVTILVIWIIFIKKIHVFVKYFFPGGNCPKSYFKHKGQLQDLGIIWKDTISGVCMSDMKSLYLLQFKRYREG